MDFQKYFVQAEGRYKRQLQTARDCSWNELLTIWDDVAKENQANEVVMQKYIDLPIENVRHLVGQYEKYWRDSRNDIKYFRVAPDLRNTTALTEIATHHRRHLDSLKEVLTLKESGLNSVVDKKVLLTIEV